MQHGAERWLESLIPELGVLCGQVSFFLICPSRGLAVSCEGPLMVWQIHRATAFPLCGQTAPVATGSFWGVLELKEKVSMSSLTIHLIYHLLLFCLISFLNFCVKRHGPITVTLLMSVIPGKFGESDFSALKLRCVSLKSKNTQLEYLSPHFTHCLPFPSASGYPFICSIYELIIFCFTFHILEKSYGIFLSISDLFHFT